MSTLDWDHFAAVVPAGTLVRGAHPAPSDGEWEGILLENKPHTREDFIANVWLEHDKKLRHLRMGDWLKMQCFRDIEDSRVMVDFPDVQYLINGQWLTFNEIMVLA